MRGLAHRWEGFWFAPEPTSTLALVRIAFGLVMLAWAISLGPDVQAFLAADGVVGRFDDPVIGRWSVLGTAPSDALVTACYAALVLGSIALIVGAASRVAALVVFVALLSIERRNPFVFNSGDSLLRVIAFVLVLTPSGAALSVDRLVRHRQDFWSFPARAPWGLRLLQIQMSVLYLSTVWQKVRGAHWNDGTAVSYSLRLDDLERFPLPGSIMTSELVSNLATYGTLAMELSLGVLVWNRKLRPYVLLLGVGMHLSIDYSLRVGFFSYAIFICYLAFVSPDAATRFFEAVRGRLRPAARSSRRQEPAGATAAAATGASAPRSAPRSRR